MSKQIKIGSELVDVTDEVYETYYKGARQRRYIESDIKVGRIKVDIKNEKVTFIDSKEDSCERLMEQGVDFEDNASVEDIVSDKAMLVILQAALSDLDADERRLINEKYDHEKTYREIGDKFGISHTAVRKRHDGILKKLKKYF